MPFSGEFIPGWGSGQVTEEEILRIYRQAGAIVRRRRVPEADAPDVIQEAVVKVWLKYGLFHERSELDTWAYRVMQNCVSDYFRRSRRRFREISALEKRQATATYQDHFELEFFDLVNRVPERYREILSLYLYQGLGMRYVAGIVGCSYTAAWSRFRRACAKLKEVAV